MSAERFQRTKSVMASGAIALVAAACAFAVSSSILGTRPAIAQHLGFDLTSGTSSFTISGTSYTTPSGTYPAASCSGTPALLAPAVTRCMVFSVHNTLKAAISVQSITTALDTTNYPAPPADCSGANLVLPSFSGSFGVSGGGTATSPGVPVELKDDGAAQNDCENYTFHFVYSGSASYTEVYGTSAALASSYNPSTTGQGVTYTATVTASASASQDPIPSSPTGTVTFKDNGTTICSSVPVISTGTTTATSQCAATYATTSGSPHPITASYANSDGNFTNSTASLSQVVNGSSTSTTSSLTSAPNPSTHGSAVTFTDTVSSGSGTPSGSVTFYSCTTSACSSKTSIGAGSLSSGKATLSTSTLPIGTTSVEAVYAGSGAYLTSTSNVMAQVVNPSTIPTTSSLTSAPNPSTHGSAVTFADTVSSGSGTPSGSVTFYSCTTSACSSKTSIGNGSLSSGKATLSTSTLPIGTTSVEAVYAGSGAYLTSTSNVMAQVVSVPVPAICAPSGYATSIVGTPAFPVVYGTNGNDFIMAFGGNYWIDGFGRNDCIDAGDGNNVIFDGDGNDGVSAGNGNNLVVVGNGNDKVSLGNGSDTVHAGDGNDTVTIGSGSFNQVQLGGGTDSVTVQGSGSHDDIQGGNGNETVSLGAGSSNTFIGQPHRTNICHLPKPPSSWHGTAAAYYHDTIVNCTVVTP